MNKVKAEELVKLLAEDSADYYRLRRRVITLPEAERISIEIRVGAILEDVKRRLYAEG